MTLNTYDQIKMVNRTYPITFTEDEFRLDEDLTYKRLYKQLNKLPDIELTNAYYLIHVKYREYFRDRSNEYLAKLYDIHHTVCEDRGIDLRKYLRDINSRKKTIDIIAVVLAIVMFIFLRDIIPLQLGICIGNALIIWKWDNVALFIAKRLNRKALHIQQYKELPYIYFMASVVALILVLRSFNSLLFLFIGYLTVLICHIICFKKYEKDVYKELEDDKKKKWTLIGRIYSAIMAILILVCLYNPTIDYIGTKFKTNSIMYFEGICTEVKNRPFGYKEATINGITVVLSTRNRDVEVGDFFRVEYGKHTKAVTNVTRKDILERFKTDDESKSSVMDNYFKELEKLEEEESEKKD